MERIDNAMKGNVAMKKLNIFDYGAVTAEKGPFLSAFEECYAYYMNLSVDDMLFELRKKNGIKNPEGAKTLANEEGSWYGQGEIVLGQWLQAYARFYAVTGKKQAKSKADELVDGLYEIALCDETFGRDLPMYHYEKFLRGFCDCFELCGNQNALILARKFVDIAMHSDAYCNARRRLGDNGTPSNPIEIEWYTMSESLLQFADVYSRLDSDDGFSDEVRAFAKRFEYKQFWDIFYHRKNIFDYSPLAGQNTAYFHSYSHLNSINGAARFYELTGDDYYLRDAENFSAFMREKQEMITGGYGPHSEWIMPTTGIINALETRHDNFETQCCSYAVYRIGAWLMSVTGRAEYGNWSEKLLYNATLASIPTDESGHVQYYSDYCTTGATKFLHDNSWTCCTGSRPLLMSELLRCVYFYQANDLYVNLFVPSRVSLNGISVRIETEYPYENEVKLMIEKSDGNSRKIGFRIPEFAKSCELTKNGKKIRVEECDGWLIAEEKFYDNDVLVLKIETQLEWSVLECLGEGVVGLKCGAVALATSSTPDEVKASIDFTKPAAEQLCKIAPLQFESCDKKVVFRPYIDFKKGEKYFIYFETGRKVE